MKHIIKKILKEGINDKVINIVLNRLKSGKIKPPYISNIIDLGLTYEEIKFVLEEYMGGKLTDYYNGGGRIRKDGKTIYDEYPGGNFVKNTFSNNNKTVFTEYPDRWVKREYDKNFNLIYIETSDEGVIIDRNA